jgi:hypothetical protein
MSNELHTINGRESASFDDRHITQDRVIVTVKAASSAQRATDHFTRQNASFEDLQPKTSVIDSPEKSIPPNSHHDASLSVPR